MKEIYNDVQMETIEFENDVITAISNYDGAETD